MLELTPQQMAALERLRARGFQFVAFPPYASHLGVRKGDCAALLAPVPNGGMQIFGEAFYLVAGNPSVLVAPKPEDARRFFVWKQTRVEATPARLDELRRFADELAEMLMTPA
jgi:hypothetical protein